LSSTIGCIAHALPTLSPSTPSIFLALVDHAVVQGRVVKLTIRILLVHSKLSLGLRPHLVHLLHRNMLLNALACTPRIPFVHVWVPVRAIVELLVKYTPSNSID
jgi:hypothetical protein